MEVRFHRLAAQEYRKARHWYDQRRPGLGAEFIAEVDRAIARIEAYPDRWPIFRGHHRRVRVQRFPYSIYYFVATGSRAHVLAVAHHRRRPGYWLRRERNP